MAAYAALVSLMHIIDNLRLHPRPPISLRKKQAESLTAKVSFLQEFLEGYNPHVGYTTKADPLEIRIADAAHAAEDVIESHIVHSITNNGKKIASVGLYKGLKTVIEEMALIEKEAMEIKETVGVQVQHQLHTKSTPLDSSISPSSIVPKSSTMVGADELLLEMKDKLTADCRDLQIIPIVGMGGTGKTTLAINIYQDRLIKEHFHICAWAIISQEYSIREIFAQVLRQFNNGVGQHLSEAELGEMLYKQLYGRKYMIIMDDMWSIDAWDRVRNYFPDNKSGSRIVVTTRLSNLASKLSDCRSLEIKLLDEANSWDLLSKIVFGEIDCPLELEEIGKKIAKSCKGLPLSIVVVGGLLAKSKRTREFWEYIEENLNETVNSEDDERCLKILHMSYKQLPVYLKPCFLHMGVFPEDEEIRTSRLIKLWVAEGFLKPVSGKSLEEIAKECLNDLAHRNLVVIHKKVGMKYCKIHDLLRDLSMREAQKEWFYTVVTRTPTVQGIINDQRRIVLSRAISKNEAIDALSSTSIARSLMWNLDKQRVPPLSLRLLRILQTCKDTPMADVEFLENMHQLVNSRFLALWVPRDFKFPCSIWLFWNLQTLIYSCFDEVTAPTDIWYLPHIRHVEFFQGLRLPDPPEDVIVLGNLHTLLRVKDFKCSEQVVKRIPNIKKLQISYYGAIDDDRYCLSNLACLDKLASLSCSFSKLMNPSGLALIFNFPHSLKKLILRADLSQYYWEDLLDKIGMLPLLEKLKLFSGSFKEGQWKTTEGQFRSLKSLSLYIFRGLRVWTTESSHFPCLEHLILGHLNEFKEIPLDFAEIPTLSVIELDYCSDSAAVSATRILEEQEDLYGEPAIQVQVKLSRKNEALESLASPNFRLKYS